jgi:FtsZ-interacting cell division protein ZipA
MTELNMSLWGAGGAIILAVIVYNFWQEYKAKKNVERAFGDHKDDVLMRPENNSTVSSQVISKARQEPVLDDDFPNTEIETNDKSNSVVATEASAVAPLPVDDFIDCIISMEFENALRGDKVLSEIQAIRIAGNKPVHFVAVTGEGKREIISHANSYAQLIVGVQLVNRSGALNELEFSELVMKLRQIADNLNAFLDIPDMKEVMDSARDLSLFVNEHDAQLSVNVVTNGAPWDISTLLAALEKQGFDARPDGRLVMLDGEGGALFTLSLNGSLADQITSRITLLLDVPCVAPKRGGFNAMVSCAKSLALRLGGSIADDSNASLDDVTLSQIQQQVEVFYGAMQAAEIPAGSTRAVRIFS